jgi:RNA recognition motif-containing protein
MSRRKVYFDIETLRKECSKCGKIQSVDEFRVRPGTQTGYGSQCRRCRNNAQNARRAHHGRPSENAAARRRYRERTGSHGYFDYE